MDRCKALHRRDHNPFHRRYADSRLDDGHDDDRLPLNVKELIPDLVKEKIAPQID